MTTILLPCKVQLGYKDNLLETIVNLLDFYRLNLWRNLSGGLGWSMSHCKDAKVNIFHPDLALIHICKLLGRRKRSFSPRVRPTVHTYPSEKRAF